MTDADDYSTCSQALTITFTIALSVLMVAGFIGNIMIVVAFYKTQNLRTSANYYIVNMAASDLIFILIIGPWSITELLTEPLRFIKGTMGLVLCQTVVVGGNVLASISVASLLLITKDRFIASVYPMKVTMITKNIRRMLLLLTWVLAVVFNIPFAYYTSLVRFNGVEYCWLNGNIFTLIYSFVGFILWYCLPLVLIITLYYEIIKTLRRPRPGNRIQQSVLNMKRRIQNKKIMKILISIVVAFFLCWTLYYMYIFVVIFDPALVYYDECLIMVILANYLFPLLNTVINPVVLFTFGTNYLAALRSWRLCQCKCSQGSVAPQNETEHEEPDKRRKLRLSSKTNAWNTKNQSKIFCASKGTDSNKEETPAV